MRTLLVSLGGADYPHAENLRHAAFAPSSHAVAAIFGERGLNMVTPSDHLDLFNTPQSWPDQLIRIRNWIREARSVKPSPSDLIIHYVGHGSFTPNSDEYFLTINHTDSEEQGETSVGLHSLYKMLSRNAHNTRIILLIDACFAAAALRDLMSGDANVVLASKMRAIITPEREEAPVEQGIAVLCSSDKADFASAAGREGLTQFTDGLITVLESGDPQINDRLSIGRVAQLIKHTLASNYHGNAIFPVLHAPENKGRTLSSVPLFPNRARNHIEDLLGILPEDVRAKLQEPVTKFVTELADSAGDDLAFEKMCDQLRNMGRREMESTALNPSSRGCLGYDCNEQLDSFIALVNRCEACCRGMAGWFAYTFQPKAALDRFTQQVTALRVGLKGLHEIRDAFLMEAARVAVEREALAKARNRLVQMSFIASALQESIEVVAVRKGDVNPRTAELLRGEPHRIATEHLQLLLTRLTDADRWDADLKAAKEETHRRVSAFDNWMPALTTRLYEMGQIGEAATAGGTASKTRAALARVEDLTTAIRQSVEILRPIAVRAPPPLRPASI
jgi:hypothetical protein